MNAVLPLLKPGALVYATKPGPILAQYMQEHGCIPIDFTQSEAFTLRNAIPSAEGSIHAVMSRAGVCLSGSKCLVVGYGRLGRALALRLMGLRAQVYVAARSPQARAQAEGDGCRALTMEELATPRGCRFVFNTVPVPVLGEAAFAALAPGALAVDVSSPPYGFALDTAQAMGVGAWREPGLPGRYAPETAAEAMLSVIEEKDGA
jgi:dipicolinate synthase subunit A